MASPQMTDDVPPAGAARGPSRPPAPAADPVLRGAEPVPADLRQFLVRRLGTAPSASARGGTKGGAVATPHAPGPWPLDYALEFLRRVAVMLDAADAAGVGTFTPRCVALDGAHLVIVRDDDPTGEDAAYVAPERRRAGADAGAAQDTGLDGRADGRARQYGLAVLAGGLLAARGGTDRSPADPVERVLRIARNPDPARRFSTAGDFVSALEAACGDWAPAAAVAPVAAAPAGVASSGVSSGAPAAADAPPTPRRHPRLALLLGAAALAGTAAGSLLNKHLGGAPLLAAHPTGRIGDRVDFDAANVWVARREVAHHDLARTLGAATAAPRAEAPNFDVLTIGDGLGPTAGAAAERSAAAPLPGVEGPRYPAALQKARVTGDVVARLTVDTTGRVVRGSFALVRSSHPLFTTAVREALGSLRYSPAERGGRRVPQTIEQTFRFAPGH